LKRVLVTGANGFIGRCALPLLQVAGYEVHAVSSQARTAQPNIVWHQVDLLANDAANALVASVQPSHLLHLAWYSKPNAYWRAPENFLWVQASLGLLQAFAAHGGTRIIMAGSCAEYDWRYGWCSEQVTPLAPSSPYGHCKHALQSLVAAYSQQAGLSWAWGRIFFLYGPHEHPARLVASVINALLRGQPALCSSGEQMRDFLHVADVAAAFVALLDSDVQDAVNIASGRPVAVKEIVQYIGAALQREDLLRMGARPAAVGEPPLLAADVRRLIEEVKWRQRIELDAGLSATITWWRDNL
jgi:nucleoside-diphosphate-sugar epimerase